MIPVAASSLGKLLSGVESLAILLLLNYPLIGKICFFLRALLRSVLVEYKDPLKVFVERSVSAPR